MGWFRTRRAPQQRARYRKRLSIVERYWATAKRCLRGQNRLQTRAKADRNRWAEQSDRNRPIRLSRIQVGWCAGSTRLLQRKAEGTCWCSTQANCGRRCFAARELASLSVLRSSTAVLSSSRSVLLPCTKVARCLLPRSGGLASAHTLEEKMKYPLHPRGMLAACLHICPVAQVQHYLRSQ